MIPEGMLPHTLTVITPTVVQDGYGEDHLEYDADALDDPDDLVTNQITGWLQQNTGSEDDTTDGNRLIGTWLLITNATITGRDRIVWGDLTFAVEGPPAPAYTPSGEHHTEAILRLVEG